MPNDSQETTGRGWLRIIGPGLLIAATGVGAGDLASAGFAGSQLGTAVLWAVVLGAFFKFVMTEGLTRWQLATDQTLLEGAISKLGKVVGWVFLPYLLLWSFFIGSALMSACGVTLHAIFPVFENPSQSKIVFGIASSLIGMTLVFFGGFKLFERVMSVCVAVMFVTVIISAALILPSMEDLLSGLFIPRIPDIDGSGIAWTLALIGGVGGTVTILCYGYWIAEEGRTGVKMINLSRIDLGIGYLMTALFGIAMVVIGSGVNAGGSGAGLIVEIASTLKQNIDPLISWLFLIGALGAVFSSLLGVWQSVPYLFSDLWRLLLYNTKETLTPQEKVRLITKSKTYRYYLVGISLVPMLGLFLQFKDLQKLYGIIGAAFLPLLTIALLLLNSRAKWVGTARNRPLTIGILISVLVFFGWMTWRRWIG